MLFKRNPRFHFKYSVFCLTQTGGAGQS